MIVVYATDLPTVGETCRTAIDAFPTEREAQGYADWENERADYSFYYVEVTNDDV